MRRYQTLLFDADMTLFDFNRAEIDAFGIVMGAHGIQYSESDFSRYHEINAALWERFGRGEITKPFLQTERFAEFLRSIGAEGKADPAEINAGYVSALAECSRLLDGAEELCKALADEGFDMYIVTNGVSKTQKKRFAASTIKQYFSGLFVSEDAGEPKPSAAYFDYVFAHIGEGRRCGSVIIGDSLTSDIAGGITAGIDTVWYNPEGKENNTAFVPTFEVRSFTELYNLLIKGES